MGLLCLSEYVNVFIRVHVGVWQRVNMRMESGGGQCDLQVCERA